MNKKGHDQVRAFEIRGAMMMLWNAKNGCVRIGDADMDYVSFERGTDNLIILPGLGDGLMTVKVVWKLFERCFEVVPKLFKRCSKNACVCETSMVHLCEVTQTPSARWPAMRPAMARLLRVCSSATSANTRAEKMTYGGSASGEVDPLFRRKASPHFSNQTAAARQDQR